MGGTFNFASSIYNPFYTLQIVNNDFVHVQNNREALTYAGGTKSKRKVPKSYSISNLLPIENSLDSQYKSYRYVVNVVALRKMQG